MENSSNSQRGKQRKITDYFQSADTKGCSNAQRGKQRKITDYFRSADKEGCSSTSFETFKHYEPSPVQHHKKYHVFLSFRGPDVRNTFVDHLYISLKTAGFYVFFDEERLEKGKKIKDSLEDAIRNSTVHIPIFSADYASSSWCLDELSLMSTCTGTTIIPLFYNVKPSYVRYPDNVKSPYAKEFQKHRENGRHSKEEINAWKGALHQVSDLSGWSLAGTTAGKEGKLVKLVVMDLLKTLRINDLDVAKHPVGLADRKEEVKRLLEMNEDGPLLFVGIWGMGGSGKTTLAKDVYNNIHLNFEAFCFVSDVRAEGLLQLQKQMLRDLAKLDESTLKRLNSVSDAKTQMKHLLGSKNALVILDDVDQEEQLDALVGDACNGYWFGEGSRIIITTRDSRVWKRQTPVIPYSMRGLDKEEGLNLFSWHAFMRPGPPEEYKGIAEKIVDACQGLPLSLEVVGASLYSEKSLEIWMEALTNLKNLVKNNEKVYYTLKISYNALSDEEKRMFLDIAFFFLGPLSFPSTRYDMKFYVDLWKALGCSAPRICLKNLEMKSLIRINYGTDHRGYSILWMHDLLRDLGRRIIEEECLSNPAERIRFWDHKDPVTAMAQTQTMPNVEGLVLDFSQAEEGLHQTYCSPSPWELMPNLKFMFISGLCQEGHINLPRNLIFLGLWSCRFQEDESASETQPISFSLPKTIGGLRSLRFLDMTGTSICHLPNEVGELFNLEESYLSECNLRELSQCFANLSKLKVLDISYNHLSSFPANFHLPSRLIKLHLKGCSNLQKMPSMSHMEKLEVLDVSGCQSLTELPLLGSMYSLKDLKLEDCEELQALPALPDTLIVLNLSGCRKLQEASNMSHLKKLESLDLFMCTSLTELPSLDSMHSLKYLKLEYCEELQALPALPDTFIVLNLSGCCKLQEASNISHLKKLESLDLFMCKSLAELPSLDTMHSLKDLKLEDCEELQALPALPDTLSHLDLNGCCKLQEASGISHLTKLKSLDLSRCKSLKELPSLDSMHFLRRLKLRGCEELKALPALVDTLRVLNLSGCRKLQEASSISHLEKLESLDLSMCTSLSKLPSLDFMHCLIYLKLWNCEELKTVPALPDTFSGLDLSGCRKLQEVSSISHLKKLESLDLSGCTSLSELPSLNNMHFLTFLKLWNCEELQTLPALPDSLSRLYLNGCRKLREVSSISHLKKLEVLDVSRCTSLTELPPLDLMLSSDTEDFSSADMEGCSITSAGTFKNYKPFPAQHHKRYHVFLSFGGRDVRNTLVDHLFKSLSTAGFHVFLDEKRLEKGMKIKDSLEDAIRNSTVHIPIFSADYASSMWCLDKLSFMRTRISTASTVIPLFYKVKPSDVRFPDKKGLYAKAFQEQRRKKRHSEEEINAWREALHKVSLLSGWSLSETMAGDEGRLVKLVVRDLLETFGINRLYVAKPDGLSDRMEKVIKLLELNDHGRPVLCVGICGMGGLGKTSLAKAVYNKIRHMFEESCFVSNVQASTKNSQKGLLKLQQQILRDLAKVHESTLKKLNSVPNAKVQMENLLRSIKALVILDDVDDVEQLDALVGDGLNGCWFGAGSRIIVTTRELQVLKRQTPVILRYSI